MASLFNVGISGLMAYQRALATTGHNITNLNTPGYSRQVVNLTARTPSIAGGILSGNGVAIGENRRYADQFLNEQVNSFTSTVGYFQNYQMKAAALDKLFSSETAGLSSDVTKFFSAVKGVADNPASVEQRKLLMNAGRNLTNKFHSLHDRLQGEVDTVNFELETLTDQVNTLSKNIAELNGQIAQLSNTGQKPSDLLDQRDQLLTQLSSLVPIDHYEGDGGVINVQVKNGPSLVVGGKVSELGVVQNPDHPEFKDIAVINGNNFSVIDNLATGEIASVLDYREEMLVPALNELGNMALALAGSFNDVHRLGVNLEGNTAVNFFEDINAAAVAQSRIFGSSANTGNGLFRVNVSDISQLNSDEYRLTLSGSTYTLQKLSDNSTVATFPDTDLPYTVPNAGITIELDSGAVADGDSFIIRPARYASGMIDMTIANEAQIAAAAAINVKPGVKNGTGTIAFEGITNQTGSTPPAVHTITFDSAANEFTVVPGGATIPYDPATDSGSTLTITVANFGDINFKIEGTPQDGDTFELAYNASGSGNGDNATALYNTQFDKTLKNGKATLFEAYNALVGDVGAKTQDLGINVQSSSSLLKLAQDQRTSVAGVNLDEEAANLLRFQQAYQASAQVVSAANRVFDILFAAVSR